ncbi:hypothetical protein AV530_010456 [Patagioenas fasciata monilis]|uniref:Uncharacterized protein n=1 Tax=Patagioenas fasciata monilis TaxID=372326 RepID=A0A1V4KEX4_PATFA|nr:hypothetical protein AV530_010456 [Patagioenas fasciata monilis]
MQSSTGFSGGSAGTPNYSSRRASAAPPPAFPSPRTSRLRADRNPREILVLSADKTSSVLNKTLLGRQKQEGKTLL